MKKMKKWFATFHILASGDRSADQIREAHIADPSRGSRSAKLASRFTHRVFNLDFSEVEPRGYGSASLTSRIWFAVPQKWPQKLIRVTRIREAYVADQVADLSGNMILRFFCNYFIEQHFSTISRLKTLLVNYEMHLF